MIGMVNMVSPFLTLRGPSSSACVRSSRSVWAAGIGWSSPVATAGEGIIAWMCISASRWPSLSLWPGAGCSFAAWARLPRSLFPDPGSHPFQNLVNKLFKKLFAFAACLAGVSGLAGWLSWLAWLAWLAGLAGLAGLIWLVWLAWLGRYGWSG